MRSNSHPLARPYSFPVAKPPAVAAPPLRCGSSIKVREFQRTKLISFFRSSNSWKAAPRNIRALGWDCQSARQSSRPMVERLAWTAPALVVAVYSGFASPAHSLDRNQSHQLQKIQAKSCRPQHQFLQCIYEWILIVLQNWKDLLFFAHPQLILNLLGDPNQSAYVIISSI